MKCVDTKRPKHQERMSIDFMTDPLWYKDAVIYELHVRSFFDSNNDGYGDFEGLRQKLTYLESLGVNTLWLLPFLESPLRDDGYDTSDYLKVLPVHGTLEDFKAFLNEAHRRGMRVLTELVLNHTSDQHPWFQEARNPASPKHDWYVWSDTLEKYKGTRIIFTDTEFSNWTWDQKAGRYYWHRFFSHQPDLNYDNPEVRETMKEVMFYWLDMGVDGLRLDAVPYLYEREGTNCENLPETIEYIKELRAAIEERYGPGKILLAEANQWPEDTLPYFAGGAGVQMAFNFPIMPRMYMAVRRENRRPLVEMLEHTADIPEEAQWAVFLRNHDELTLEMVTDEERDYMYYEYATDPRFRINVGIRRRLAPLLGGERRRIELMNALLLSLKGSPILYYGDEIGMGDDPFLGDRNGVRTPMQWSADKNGGFSRAPHHKLFMPAINRSIYSYEFINVEDADSDPHSLLHFMKRMLALRRQYAQVFGRGTFKVIPVENQSILAFMREYEGQKVLVVANLSRFAQSMFLPPLEELKGFTPVELFSKTPFPAIGGRPYHMPLGPLGFYWFALEPEKAKAATRRQRQWGRPALRGELPVLHAREGLQNLLVKTLAHDSSMEQFEALLPEHILEQRWFGAKGEEIQQVTIADAVRLATRPAPMYISILNVTLPDRTDAYLLPLILSYSEEAERVLEEHPNSALAWLETPDGHALLHDATASPEFWVALFKWWQSGGKGRSLKGVYAAHIDEQLRNVVPESTRLLSGEQSNSAAIINGEFFVKLYRRLEVGINPESELLEYLTQSGFKFIPRLYGTVSFNQAGERHVMGILQEALPVETDGWTYALEMMQRFLDRVQETVPPEEDRIPLDYSEPAPAWIEEVAPEMLSLAHMLGIRTAEMHLALSRAEAPFLKPIEGSLEDTTLLIERIRREAGETRRLLDQTVGRGNGQTPPNAAWKSALQQLDLLSSLEVPRQKIRIHGDYHLGQVLRSEGEFYILDFEGEPARSIEERRSRDYALRDVAGMLRSLEYAALAAWRAYREKESEHLKNWTRALVRWCEALFLNAYFGSAEQGHFILPKHLRRPFLWAYLLDKALYEVRYELNHRPDWVWLPLEGLKRLLATSQEYMHTPEPVAEQH
jgi:maltose alpha-D-glucosyltransferase / alpha-amylase